MLFGGGLVAIMGVAVILAVRVIPVALTGFLLVGLGTFNIVPVLFLCRKPGRYSAGIGNRRADNAGFLVGRAGIGLLAKALNLTVAFWILGRLLRLLPLTARRVVGAEIVSHNMSAFAGIA